ncbi:MAG: hypothetical protein M3069_20370 [Chloroflexota bacterium]|nr:hypothetical protein [Chloroflexota bacterium]
MLPNLGPIIASIPLIVVGFVSSPQQGVLALVVAVTIQQLETTSSHRASWLARWSCTRSR